MFRKDMQKGEARLAQADELDAEEVADLATGAGILACDEDTLVVATWTMGRMSRRARISSIAVVLLVAPAVLVALDALIRPGAPAWEPALVGLLLALGFAPWALIETRIVATTASPGIMRESFNMLTRRRKRRMTIVAWADVEGYEVASCVQDEPDAIVDVLRIVAAGKRVDLLTAQSARGAHVMGRHLMAIARRARLRESPAPG